MLGKKPGKKALDKEQKSTELDRMVDDSQQPLISHLVELRTRLMRSILLILALFCGLYYFANDLYLILSRPLQAVLPTDGDLIATGVASPFLVPLKLTIVSALMLSVPYLLHQIWSFIAPGLYNKEKKFAIPLLLSSIFLFYSGVAFAYFAVLPLVFGFFASIGPEGIAFTPDINNVLNFALKIFFAFGIAFEIPIATFLLILTGITSVEQLSQKRPYIFIGCFVIGMLITPPDVFSQAILAIPMWLLFEVGLLFGRTIKQPEEETEEEAETQATAETKEPT